MTTIGNVLFDSPVFLAPMSGVTDEPFRSRVKSFGDIFTFTEMIASNEVINNSFENIQKLKNFTDSDNAIQLVGSDPDILKKAAILSEETGTSFVDINMGCPARKVVNTYCGAALMRDEELVKRILTSICESVKAPVTLKMRLGWDEDNLNALKIALIAQECGVQMITIHARTRQQMFKDKARWNLVKIIKDNIKIPVIINGDITCEDSAAKALLDSNADGIMIGRGAYGQPWLPSKIKYFLKTGTKINDPSLKEQEISLLEHYENILSYYGNYKGSLIARKHIQWSTKKFHNAKEFFKTINKEINPANVKEKIKNIFTDQNEYLMRNT